MQPSVEYLGHRIDAEGVHTTTRKVDAILKVPTPGDVEQLRSFRAFCIIITKPLLTAASIERTIEV